MPTNPINQTACNILLFLLKNNNAIEVEKLVIPQNESGIKYKKLFSSIDNAILVHIIAISPINPSILNIISICLSFFNFSFKTIAKGTKIKTQTTR